jgi:AcrR family transcriptional regulator
VPDPVAGLRSDARRNREKILAAASELFAEHGAELCVGDIARRAGVGQATVFRRFPTKRDLVLAIFRERLEAVARHADEAARAPDAWEGLVAVMSEIAERQASDKGLFEAVGSDVMGSQVLRDARERVLVPLAALLRRAQAEGSARPDLEPQDLLFLVTAAGHACACRMDVPGLWRRYLGVILDGMRPGGATPLSPPAPGLEEIESAFSAASSS